MSKAKLQSLILIASLLLNALFLGLFLSPFLFKGPSPIRKVFMTAMLKRHPLLSEFHEALMKNHAKNDFKSVRTKISAAISAEEFNEAEDKINEDGFFITRNLINKEINRVCPVCETYSFSGRDDLYMNKYQCCHTCYLKWVEHDEKKWLEGWRPDKEQN